MTKRLLFIATFLISSAAGTAWACKCQRNESIDTSRTLEISKAILVVEAIDGKTVKVIRSFRGPKTDTILTSPGEPRDCHKPWKKGERWVVVSMHKIEKTISLNHQCDHPALRILLWFPDVPSDYLGVSTLMYQTNSMHFHHRMHNKGKRRSEKKTEDSKSGGFEVIEVNPEPKKSSP